MITSHPNDTRSFSASANPDAEQLWPGFAAPMDCLRILTAQFQAPPLAKRRVLHDTTTKDFTANGHHRLYARTFEMRLIVLVDLAEAGGSAAIRYDDQMGYMEIFKERSDCDFFLF